MTIRTATESDIEAIRELISKSVRGLQAEDYSEEQMSGALGSVFGVDTVLVQDGTYLLAERDAHLVGCGGWSRRKTLFGSDGADERNDGFLDPLQDAAKIRAMFVHPDWARSGVGSGILDAAESAARLAGFDRFELGATLTGIRFYERFGYVRFEDVSVPLPNGQHLPIVKMRKG